MLTLNAEILSALIDNAHDAGLFSDALEAAIAGADGQELGHESPLDLDGCDYPTRIVLTTTAQLGDKVSVEYRTNAGTPDEYTHVACYTYLNDL